MYERYQKIYDDTCKVQVEKVKLGDVNYYLQCKELLMQDLIEKAEQTQLEWKNANYEALVEYAQGKIEGFQTALETLIEIRNLINDNK